MTNQPEPTPNGSQQVATSPATEIRADAEAQVEGIFYPSEDGEPVAKTY